MRKSVSTGKCRIEPGSYVIFTFMGCKFVNPLFLLLLLWKTSLAVGSLKVWPPSPKSVDFSLVLLFQNILLQSSNIRKSVILKNVAILHPCSDQSRKVLQTSRGVARGGTIPRASKSRNSVASTFYNTLHLLRKTLGSNMGAPNLLCPGRHLTSLRPCRQDVTLSNITKQL